MASQISEKLDFLMKLTATKNASLGRVLNYDASYISRIRNGKRGLPPNQPFIEPTAAYFAHLPLDDYQKSVLSHELNTDDSWPENPAEAEVMLAAWLRNELSSKLRAKDIVSAIASPLKPVSQEGAVYHANDGISSEIRSFFGNNGKRDAVYQFLNDLVEKGISCELYLNSNESMDWLYEDPAFAVSWASLMSKVCEQGCRIKIIHSLGRDINEMWEAIKKWMPLYLSGNIEPYYYPRLRDGLFKKTLFVACGHSALLSSSVAGQKSQPLNMIIKESTSVLALENEFNAFISMCRPLMQTVRVQDRSELTGLFEAFAEIPGTFRAIKTGDIIICLKDSGSLVLKTTAPLSVFIIKEPRMISALEEYVLGTPSDSSQTSLKEADVRRLLSE